MNTIQQTQKSKDEIGQEIEILLSNDFGSMNLEELKKIEAEYKNLANQYENRPSWTKAQYAAWQFMYFRIKQEENKTDACHTDDIFYSSWGYDQTNIEYFKVVSISKTGKTAQVVRIGEKQIGETGFMSAQVAPDPTKIINPTECKVRIERSHSANPWSGKSEAIGEIQLRGSVFYSGDSKHLTSLYRAKGTQHKSWYA